MDLLLNRTTNAVLADNSKALQKLLNESQLWLPNAFKLSASKNKWNSYQIAAEHIFKEPSKFNRDIALALQLAIENGYDTVYQDLLQRVSMGLPDNLARRHILHNGLCAAIRKGSLELTKEILKKYATIDPSSLGGPLEIAAGKGCADIVAVLVSALIECPPDRLGSRELSDLECGDHLRDAIRIASMRRDKATLAFLLPAYLDRSENRSKLYRRYHDGKTLDMLDSPLLETFPIESILRWLHVAEIPDALRRCLSGQLEQAPSDMSIRLGEALFTCRQEVMAFWSPHFKTRSKSPNASSEVILDSSDACFTSAGVRAVLDFTKSGKYIHDPDNNPAHIFYVADYWLVSELQSQMMKSIPLAEHLEYLKRPDTPSIYRRGIATFLKQRRRDFTVLWRGHKFRCHDDVFDFWDISTRVVFTDFVYDNVTWDYYEEGLNESVGDDVAWDYYEEGLLESVCDDVAWDIVYNFLYSGEYSGHKHDEDMAAAKTFKLLPLVVKIKEQQEQKEQLKND